MSSSFVKIILLNDFCKFSIPNSVKDGIKFYSSTSLSVTTISKLIDLGSIDFIMLMKYNELPSLLSLKDLTF